MSAARGSTLTGTGALAKLAVRRDRVMLAVWLYAFAAFVGATVYGFRNLYPTAAGREQFVLAANHNAALLSIYGPFYGTSLGSFTSWRDVSVAALLAGLMSVFIVVRHTRADEEAGRLELVGSAVVGRHAALASAMLVAVGANLVIGVVIAVVAVVLGLPAAGSILMAAGIAGCGLVFTAIAAVTAQVAATARSARGIALGVLGAAFLLRAIGESMSGTGPRWLTWLSPIGWAEFGRAFGDTQVPSACAGGPAALLLRICYTDQRARWWVLALPVVTAALAAALAAVLAVRRDYGAGLMTMRPGRAAAAASLRSPLALAWRLQRASVFAWVAGALVYGVGVGSAAKGISGLLGSDQIRRIVAKLGGEGALTSAHLVTRLTNDFLAAILSMAGLAVAGFAISAVLRLRSEETDQHADPVLATRAGRVGWGLSHLLIAVAGTVTILAVAGIGAGLGYGARSGALGSETVSLLEAGLAQAPAVLVLAGLAAALFGLAPRASVAVSWSALGVVVLMLFIGVALQWSHWVLDVSPFTHVPKLPGGAFSAVPLAWLGAIAVALAVAGLAGLRYRDIANTG